MRIVTNGGDITITESDFARDVMSANEALLRVEIESAWGKTVIVVSQIQEISAFINPADKASSGMSIVHNDYGDGAGSVHLTHAKPAGPLPERGEVTESWDTGRGE